MKVTGNETVSLSYQGKETKVYLEWDEDTFLYGADADGKNGEMRTEIEWRDCYVMEPFDPSWFPEEIAEIINQAMTQLKKSRGWS